MDTIEQNIKIFTGNANKPFAQAVANELNIPLGKAEVDTFSDGEIHVNILETVRGSDVFIIQSTSHPVNNNLMELLILIDAFKRASAKRITAVIPYYGYARQDRKTKARDPITAKIVANLLTKTGADRVLTMDLHAPQIQGFFDIPVDNLLGMPILAPYIKQKIDAMSPIEGDFLVMSPDLGSVDRCRRYAERLNIPLVIVDKRRSKPNESEIMHIIGDVKDKNIILVDDMIDTAGTLCNAACAAINNGAKNVYAYATHGVLSGPALQRLSQAPIKEIFLLDTVDLPARKHHEKIKQISCSNVFATAIQYISSEKPVSKLFT